MQRKRLWQAGLAALFCAGAIAVTMTAIPFSTAAGHGNMGGGPNLVTTVRKATEGFKSEHDAEAAGYAMFHGCASGPQEGAMGVHYVNGNLVGDGEVDAQHPEALMYEPKNGDLQLLGVEYVVLAEAWNAKHQTPPVLMGQLFNYAGAPNRYGIPAYYYLHVWAWKNNPAGVFADWNPQVSCEQFTINE